MNFSKVKELYFKYQLPFTLAISTLVLVISAFWNPALYIAVGFVIISYIFSKVEDICSGTFYFMLYSGITIFFMSVAVSAILVLFGKYIYDACKGRVKVYKYILILTTAISVIFSLIHYQIDGNGVFLGLYVIAILYFTYVIFCYHKELSFKRMFKYLFIGFIASMFITLVLALIPSAKVTRLIDGQFIEVNIKTKMFLVFNNYYRLELLTYHPNYLSIHSLMLISYGIYSLINYKQTKDDLIMNIAMIAVPTIAGFLTLSKAFYILFIVVLIYVIIYFIYKYKSKSLIYIIPLLVGVVALFLIFRGQIQTTIGRLLPNEDGNDLNDMTTGRLDIWKNYLNDLISSPLKILFGEGLFTGFIGMGPHNFYLFILFKFGIVGALMLAGLVVLYVLAYDGKLLFSFKRILPLAIFLIYSIQESEDDERIIFLVVTLILMFLVTIDDKNLSNVQLNEKMEAANKVNKNVDNKEKQYIYSENLEAELEEGGSKNAN